MHARPSLLIGLVVIPSDVSIMCNDSISSVKNVTTHLDRPFTSKIALVSLSDGVSRRSFWKQPLHVRPSQNSYILHLQFPETLQQVHDYPSNKHTDNQLKRS